MWFSKRALHLIAFATGGLAVTLAATAAAVADGDGNAPKAPGAFLDVRRQQPISGDVQAGKALSNVCSACHGANGLGIAPTFPDLAGQSATYLYVQLKTFKDGERSDPVMGPLVASLGDAEMRNLAAYYASLPPKPGAGAAAASPGGRLFSDGDPSRGIPPCQGCHGANGKGPRSDADVNTTQPRPPWATIPRLQGQSGTYVAKALHDFKSGARGKTSNAKIMQGVAKSLSEADIKAVADFVDAH
ncbi:c-type cytochrome [Pseudoxanthomonas sangjuensis]|nr:cytochrome C [Pseudoxanthomonas sangjuensis]